MRPGPARSGKHLIIKFARIVFRKKFGHEFSLSPPLRRANKKERVNYMPSPQSSPTGRGGHRSRVPRESGRETVREAPGEGSPFLRGLDLSAAPFFIERTSRKNGAVRLIRFFATCSGVPVATISPPASPASGPISTM